MAKIFNLETLENDLGYTFKDKSFLQQALSHSSYINNIKRTLIDSNERLEFLGDRVLGLVIAHHLYQVFNDYQESSLAHAIAYLNSKDILYKVAVQIHLDKYVQVASNTTKKNALETIYANALEAILAAIYLDSNYDTIQAIIVRLWKPYIHNCLQPDTLVNFNPKSWLQEWAQQNNLPLPNYLQIKKEGSEHSPIFTIALEIKGHPTTTAKANSKKLAEKKVALAFISNNNLLKHNE